MSSIDLATRFKNGVDLLNREKRFFASTGIQVLNELPTDNFKTYKGTTQYTVMPYTRRQQEIQVFEKNLFKCVKRPELSGVFLISLITRYVNMVCLIDLKHNLSYLVNLFMKFIV